MSNRRHHLTADKKIELEAAAWLIRCDRSLTPAEQDRYLEWLAEDPRHGEWVARCQRTWKRLDLLAEWRPEHSVEPNPDLLARPCERRFRWALPGALAMAAGVAVMLAIWRPWMTETTARPAALAQTEPSFSERRVLEDGSVVELNRGAEVEVVFTAAERRVRLVRGEAHFTVAKNPLRLFVVRAGGVDFRAVGTAFDVRLAAESVELLVTEGRVEVIHVDPPSSVPAVEPAPALVAAGQRTVISLSASALPPRVVEVSAEEMTRLLAWQAQTLDFDSTPLAQVVAEFNRRNRVQLVIDDPSLRLLPIVASFRSNNVEGFVRLLELTAEVHAERSGDRITLRRSR